MTARPWLGARAGRTAGDGVPGAGGMLAPFAVAAALLVGLPALLTVWYAFTNATGLNSPRFNGLDNVRRLQADPLLRASLTASLVHLAIAVPVRLLLAAGLGLLLAARRRGAQVYRAAVFLPTVLPDLALALVFLWVFNPLFGPLNRILGLVGLPQPNWFATAWGARTAVIVMLAFPIGEAFLVVLSARRTISPTLYEAAALDGYGPFGQLRRITLPLLAPVLVLLSIRDLIFLFQASFVPGYLLTDGRPGNATLYLPLYIYDHAFEFSGLGYAALLTLVMSAVTLVLIGVLLMLVRRWRLL